MKHNKTITVAMTGASGAPYTLRLLDFLLSNDYQVRFICSQPGQIVFAMETDLKLSGSVQSMKKQLCEYFSSDSKQLSVYAKDQWTAPVASGSSVSDVMIICPCSMGTLAAVANGISDNLIHRAADVVIKENKKLILVPRETPFSSIHLENMLKLARLGISILPPSPGFYNGETTLQEVIDFIVARILDQAGIENTIAPRWSND
ncbi:MAG: UbiX family flavin prenyltransferase [Gammaproteobacteria bacterium]|nr:UbiX family flavin prenyltransferase [Gammaproteobacteria bacterium]